MGGFTGDSTIIPRGQEFEIEGDQLYGDSHAYSVDPATVGQYTGLKDKNGKKIFEGDIMWSEDFQDDGYVSIAYAPTFSIAGEDFIEDLTLENISDSWTSDLEIIGNIHDKEDEE